MPTAAIPVVIVDAGTPVFDGATTPSTMVDSGPVLDGPGCRSGSRGRPADAARRRDADADFEDRDVLNEPAAVPVA